MQLYLRPIHPEFFTIHARRSLSSTSYDVEIWITGLSHVLTLQHRSAGGHTAERCLTEVVGPIGFGLPDRGRVHQVALKGENEVGYTLRNGFQYNINYHCEKLDEDVFAATYDRLRHQQTREALACEFRIEDEQTQRWPLAIVIPTHARGGFLLHAFHVFPHERTILKTQTLIDMPALHSYK